MILAQIFFCSVLHNFLLLHLVICEDSYGVETRMHWHNKWLGIINVAYNNTCMSTFSLTGRCRYMGHNLHELFNVTINYDKAWWASNYDDNMHFHLDCFFCCLLILLFVVLLEKNQRQFFNNIVANLWAQVCSLGFAATTSDIVKINTSITLK